MSTKVKRISTMEELKDSIKYSKKKPVFIFKHDDTLEESQKALEEYMSFIEENEEEVDFTVIDVREYIEVSEAVEDILEVSHVAPQLIFIMDEEVVWDDRGANINSDNILEVLNEFLVI
ncbi:DUF2847 family protein [Serpentinicella sp. ANB-PHB4]|uniref:monothiol bacilliredoxin BrxC family protein n=1 Tax=Serpentinicella sp. ANB-PHB4 TaxID=3074076 RepID=UPI002863A305|nr:monothiol bacilliredoxin BrxC family protein [Serpentinicella sp. ANB-PHB4]MDR5659006.1 DUF2847 family protein [Serpentinicella sp. ANB-PHB4]